jgi:hypothetical protein
MSLCSSGHGSDVRTVYFISNSLEQSHPQETKKFSASHEMPLHLMKLEGKFLSSIRLLYGVFFFLLDRYTPARRFASVTSYAESREVLTVGESEKNISGDNYL